MSFPRYPEYKYCDVEWVGKVPAHWEVRRLGYFFEERREKVSDADYEPLSVTKNGIVPQLESAAKTDDGDNRKKVCQGDFVINSRSDRKGSAGLSDRDGSVSLINTVLRPREEMFGRFAHHLLRSCPFQDEFYRNGKGIVADLWSTKYSEMCGIVLAVPPYEEQITISAFLDFEISKIDALVAEQEKLIELLKEKRQSIISHAVTKGLDLNVPMKDSGIEWLGEVPAHWSIVPVSYRYEVQLGKMLDASRITGEHLRPYLRVLDVQWGKINTDNLPMMDFDENDQARFRLEVGDLLVNEGGSYVGRSALWLGEIDECYYQKALHRLRPHCPDNDTARFFYYTMVHATNLGVFVAGGNQATIEHLTAESFRRYRFTFPSIAEQQLIADALDRETTKLDGLIAEVQRAIDLLKERRSVLISAAVTGKIDVRAPVEVEQPSKVLEPA